MLDTLRAFNHEFLNKLHVILGYLQTGQTEEAIKFIINSNLVSSQSIRRHRLHPRIKDLRPGHRKDDARRGTRDPAHGIPRQPVS